MMKKFKNILVIGGAGFIGSNLCEQLRTFKHIKVTSLDNYSTGNTKNHVSGVKYLKGNASEINSIVSFEPDLVFHLGEYSRVEKSLDESHKVLSNNLCGIIEVLEFIKNTKAKLVYAGSSTKFGDVGKDSTPYSWSKSTNTELVQNYGNWFGINYAITYFYNVYGKNEISSGDYATLIGLFKTKKRKGEKLTVVKPGTQRRNFTHVNDIVSGLLMVAENGNGDGYGIGSHEDYSVQEIAELFDGEIEYLPHRKGNRNSANLITKKTLELGWQPKHSVIDYIRSNKYH